MSTLNNQPVCYRKSTHPNSKDEPQKWGQTEVNDTLNAFDNGESRTPTVVVNQNEKVYCLQGNGIDRADTAGCNGKGWREDQSYTLNTIDRPAVCVSQDAYDKFTENEKSASLKACGGNYGGGSESLMIQSGALCAADYKGAGNQYVNDGKLVIQRIE